MAELLAGIGRVVVFGKGLPMILGICQHYLINQNARDPHHAWMQAMLFDQALYLNDHKAAAVMHRLGDRQTL